MSVTPAVARASDAQPRERVPFWDNARFVCITLVVAGHLVLRLTASSDSALVTYLFIYSFHMPAFAVISGYFSKSGPPTAAQLKRVLTTIVLPYLIMETIWSLLQFAASGTFSYNPTTASWTLWFLLALAIFRLVLPYLALLRWPLLVAVVCSIGVGYWANVDSTFSLSRAIGVLPFFVLGWKLSQTSIIERWRRAEKAAVVVRAASVLLLTAWVVTLASGIDLWRSINLRHWFFYLHPYSELGASQWWAGGARLLALALAVLIMAAVFALVPRRETWFTRFGQATMYVYLLHSFVVFPIRESGLLSDVGSSPVWLVGVILASVVITLALSTAVVRRVTRPLIEPQATWLFRDRTLVAAS
jgi:fucose 4-O-acetylase-like acetyltransferase